MLKFGVSVLFELNLFHSTCYPFSYEIYDFSTLAGPSVPYTFDFRVTLRRIIVLRFFSFGFEQTQVRVSFLKQIGATNARISLGDPVPTSPKQIKLLIPHYG